MSKRAAEDIESGESSKKAKHDSESPDVLQKDGEGNFYVDLGNLKRATISVFRGKAYMNLREYYRDKASGDLKPGKKGITLDSTQWASLVANTAPLTKQLELMVAEGGGPSTKRAKAKESGKETKSEENKQKPTEKKKLSNSEVEDEDDDE